MRSTTAVVVRVEAFASAQASDRFVCRTASVSQLVGTDQIQISVTVGRLAPVLASAVRGALVFGVNAHH
jgi:hypothetical protein